MNLSRRDFTRISALGLAAQIAPRLTPVLHAQSSDHKVGYAIIGLGRISDHFMRGIQATDNSKVTALVSGHPEKAARIAAQYGVPKSSIYTYENMDAMRDNKSVDAVYIGLPNSMHAEYTIRSAKAGKHVLCEKPMATSVSDAQAMIDACKAANVKLMIAYRLHFEPTNLKAIKFIRDGNIGKVQSIDSTNGFNMAPGEWRLSRALAGGGPLMDVGIYSLNAMRYLTGEEPSDFQAFAYSDPNDPRFHEVEQNLTWTTKFPSGIVATCSTTYGGPMEGSYHVVGSQGWVEAKPAFGYSGLHLEAVSFHPVQEPSKIDEANPEKDPVQFTREADHFSNCVLHNQEPKTPGEEGLRDMKYMQAIYKSAGITLG